jgi:chain length determinant protein EpsF
MPGYMATQVDIISSPNVARKVITELRLTDSPGVKRNFQEATGGAGSIEDWLAEVLLKNLKVEPSRTSSMIDISFSGSTPQFAAVAANAFAEAYLQTTIQLKVEPSQKAAAYFTEQLKNLRDSLEQAQQKLSAYQQEKGIISVDERLDVEISRLNDLSSQLVAAQSQSSEAISRQRNSSGGSAAESPDISSSPLIQNLKSEIARAEAKFANISQTYDINHPQYQSAKAEVDNLRAELNRQIQITSGSVATNSRILQQREADIRTSLEAQKEKVLQLKQDRDVLAVLTREVDGAQRAYDLANERFSQSNMEGQSNQSEVAILNKAVAPLKPSSPKIFLNIAISFFLGIMLGLGFAVVVEMLDRRVRSPEDLIEFLQAPVLGVITREPSPTRSWLSRLFRKNSDINLSNASI